MLENSPRNTPFFPNFVAHLTKFTCTTSPFYQKSLRVRKSRPAQCRGCTGHSSAFTAFAVKHHFAHSLRSELGVPLLVPFHIMTNKGISSSIDELASDWQYLNDVQRGEKLLELRGKTSLRALANQLPCSESHLRNLICAGRAPLTDRILAKSGEISTRELVKRSKAADKIRIATEEEALDRKRTKEAQKWCEMICEWLETKGLFCSQGEVVVDEARRELFQAECTGDLPQGGPAKDLMIQEIIQRSRPPRPKLDEFSEIAWYGTWLGRWTYFAIADTVVRDRALGLAWHKQVKGWALNASKR